MTSIVALPAADQVATAPPSVGSKVLISKQLRTEWMDVMALDSSLSHVAFRCACVLGSHFNRHSGQAFLTLETLARTLQACERTAWTASKELERRGYIIIKRREFGIGTRKTASGAQVEFRAAGGKGVANIYLPAYARAPVATSNASKNFAARCDLLWERSLQSTSSKVAIRCKPTLTSSSKKNLLPAKEPIAGNGLGPLKQIILTDIGDALYRSWFSKASIISEAEETLYIGFESRFFCNAVTSKFGEKLLGWCQIMDPQLESVQLVDLSKKLEV